LRYQPPDPKETTVRILIKEENKEEALKAIKKAEKHIRKQWGKVIGRTLTGKEVMQTELCTIFSCGDDELVIEFNQHGILEDD